LLHAKTGFQGFIMAGRARTTKKLAQRIDLNYFKRRSPFRRWQRGLSMGLPVLAVVWLGGYAVTRNARVYSAGAIHSAHQVFGRNCGACHVKAGLFERKVEDHACLTCHNGPIHQERQQLTASNPTLSCKSCHVEHLGSMRLAATRDADCVRCHEDLAQHTKGHPDYAIRVTGFVGAEHPEFRPCRPGYLDPGTIKLNHQVHLKKDLRGPNGPVQLMCVDCHRPTGVQESLPYGQYELATATFPQRIYPPSRVRLRAYMAPVNYMQHCSACHPLLFDARFKGPVPHKEPPVVHDFVVRAFTEYIASHPSELHYAPSAPRVILGQPSPALPRTPAEWVSQRVAEAERVLWGKTCKECHELSYPAGPSGLPKVAKANTTLIWLPQALFDHQAHRLLACTACHYKATSSRERFDVLLPGIRTCQQCHRPGGEGTAQAGCFECHAYHDWSKQKRAPGGGFTIQELLGKSSGIGPGTSSP
jgi:hypothetical protein